MQPHTEAAHRFIPRNSANGGPFTVVHYAWSDQIGGIERLLKNLVESQQATGLCRPWILIGQRGKSKALTDTPETIPIFEIGLKSGFDVSPSKVRTAATVIRQCDLAHLHSFHPAVALAAIRAGRPIVFTEHGTFGGAESATLSGVIKKHLFSWFLKKHVTATTFNSEYTRRIMLRHYALREQISAVVYNGTSLSQPHASNNQIPAELREKLANRFVIGTFSRLVRRKRIDRLIRAFKEVSRAEAAAVLVVGDGPETARLKTLTSECGLSSSVHFAGSHPSVAPFLEIMDLCVFPAEREPFGLVAIEAYTSGKPVIVFEDGGGLVEIVQPFEPENVVSTESRLAQRIRDYLGGNVPIKNSAAYRARAMDFDIDRCANAFQSIYLTAMALQDAKK